MRQFTTKEPPFLAKHIDGHLAVNGAAEIAQVHAVRVGVFRQYRSGTMRVVNLGIDGDTASKSEVECVSRPVMIRVSTAT